MKVLLLNWRDSKHPSSGGAEVWAHRIAEGLVLRGHHVTFFAAHVDGAPEDEYVNGVRIVRRGSRLTVYREAKRFYLADPTQFDVILEEINTRPFFSYKWGSTPVVHMIHQVAKDVWKYEAPFPISFFGRYVFEPYWLKRLAGRHVLTLSPSSAESLTEYGINDAIVALPGSDDSRVVYSEKASVPTVVFLGRLVASKRPDHVIEAFRYVRNQIPNAELWMLGSGQMKQQLKKDLPAGTTLFGHVSYEERQLRLAQAHVLVATTVREGWGLNVSEGSAVGTPTIGYDSPGLRDSIPMSGGLVVPVSTEKLGIALVDFLNEKIRLTPKIATRSWAKACEQFEYELLKAIKRL
jgi:glycosyltransferase involved in cell wall biosynthesis